jgi:hypothetical protein
MISAVRVLVLVLVLVTIVKAFNMAPRSRVSTTSLGMALADYKEEMAATAAKIAGKGKFLSPILYGACIYCTLLCDT